jgi:hypothetical protein
MQEYIFEMVKRIKENTSYKAPNKILNFHLVFRLQDLRILI